MDAMLPRLIFLAGLGQLGVLAAAALVPFRLNWRDELHVLPRFTARCWVMRELRLLSIVAFAALSIFNARARRRQRVGAWGLCLRRDVLGHSSRIADRLRRQRTFDGVVAPSVISF
jgi:hypothetical protein